MSFGPSATSAPTFATVLARIRTADSHEDIFEAMDAFRELNDSSGLAFRAVILTVADAHERIRARERELAIRAAAESDTPATPDASRR